MVSTDCCPPWTLRLKYKRLQYRCTQLVLNGLNNFTCMYIFKNSYYWVTGEKNNIRLIIYLVNFFRFFRKSWWYLKYVQCFCFINYFLRIQFIDLFMWKSSYEGLSLLLMNDLQILGHVLQWHIFERFCTIFLYKKQMKFTESFLKNIFWVKWNENHCDNWMFLVTTQKICSFLNTHICKLRNYI